MPFQVTRCYHEALGFTRHAEHHALGADRQWEGTAVDKMVAAVGHGD